MQKYDPTIVKNKPCSAPTRSETISRTNAAWNKISKRTGLAWIFTGERMNSKLEGSSTQAFVKSLLIAEAFAMRLALIKTATLEISFLMMSSDNLTLIRPINNDMQVKEIHGIICDIQAICSAFVKISFFILLVISTKKPTCWLSS
ncbi:hypothetical protein YC2023_023445 [Brassica napus]